MMNEEEFSQTFTNDLKSLEALGLFVKESLFSSLKVDNFDLDKIIKIPVKPRVKELPSLIGKAFHRNKNYSDPYNDITDKVGIRFVVLTLTDVDTICDSVTSIPEWKASLDKDYEEEREKNPHVFDYQSKHYVVRLENDTEFQGVLIKKGSSCEIQIRTLMQHAYSELSHSVLYKPTSNISKKTTRSLTRSVALIEAVDDYFKDAAKDISREVSESEVYYRGLKSLYYTLFPEYSVSDVKTNIFLLSHFEEISKDISVSNIQEYLNLNPHVKDAIEFKASASHLYQQPIILFLYYLVGNKISLIDLKRRWPLDESMIKPVFIDFGESIDTYN